MTRISKVSNEKGIALMIVVLLAVAMAALALGASMLMLSVSAISRYNDRQSQLNVVADAGLEEARARLNGNRALYPDSGYLTLENGVAVTDAAGATIPNVRRWSYAGPTGITSGQYGVFGSIVVVAEDQVGNRVVRRAAVNQESFANFAYFTTIEGNIWFASGDQIWGPVHSNDQIKIHYTGATFHSSVETARTIYQKRYATFDQGYVESGKVIAMPLTADLLKLQTQGAAGGTAFVGNSIGGKGEATTRIEFVALDLNGDGDSTDANEGFVRVYQALGNANWVTGDVPTDYSSNGLRNSTTCGHYHVNGTFVSASAHPNSGPDSWIASVQNNARRCYLGGSDSLSGAFVQNDGIGHWLQWSGPVNPLVATRPDAQYLFPISRALNPGFKGVIFVQGKLAISGVVRGRLTVAATDDIVIADDVTYATDPGAGTCADVLGIFSGRDVVVADNPLNAPYRPKRPRNYRNNNYVTYDDTKDEFIHGVVLALNVFTVENYASGSTRAEKCEGSNVGRGCLYLTGGIIQRQRGAVGLTSGRGYLKRYSYDQCTSDAPPPYFPTTGHFDRGRQFDVDPTGFDINSYFRLLTAGI